LWVQPTGSRLWRFVYRFEGKQKLLALGAYPDMSLLEARRAHAEAKSLLGDGTDPCRSKQLVKMRATAEHFEFRSLAAEYLEKLERE
jgi:hypothetical protein